MSSRRNDAARLPGNLRGVMQRRSPRTRSLLRGLVAFLAVCGVLLGVAACQVRPGAAGFVGDDKIAESDVVQYVSGAAPTGADAPQQSPRNFVLGTLVLERLWTDLLRSGGGALPTDAQLTASREAALTSQSSAAPTEDQLRTALVQIGVDATFAPTYTRQAELQYFANQKLTAAGVKTQADFLAVLAKETPKVRLSPRYGTWDPATLSISGGTPGYLQLASASAAASPAG